MRADETSWPYPNPGGDEPDWAAGDGQPSWPADGIRQDWAAGDDRWARPGSSGPSLPYGDDHPSWPAGGNGQDWPRADGGPAAPRREPAAQMHHDPGVPMAPPPPPVSRVRVQATGEPDRSQQRSGPRGAADPAGAPYYEVAFGEGRVQVLVPPADQDYPADVRAGTGEMPQLAAQNPAELLDPVRQDTSAFRDADSVRLAERILSDADSQATGIKQQAMDQANAIRESAEREAEEVRKHAAYQADSLRGAEQQAEEIRRQAAEQ